MKKSGANKIIYFDIFALVIILILIAFSFSEANINGNAINDFVNNIFGKEISYSVPYPPIAPTNLTAVAVSRYQVNLKWKDNSYNEQGFRIERGTTSASFLPIARVGANVTSYYDRGVVRGKSYFYRVESFNSAGDLSNPSNIAQVFVPRK